MGFCSVQDTPNFRHLVRSGSAIDALVVALAEPVGTVLTSDLADLHSLAAQASDVLFERIQGSVRERIQWTERG